MATEGLGLLHETHQNTDCTELEVMETDSPTPATEDSGLLTETHQNAECKELEVKQTESPNWAMEDSDLQLEFTSSEVENENGPDFDFERAEKNST